MDGIGGDSIAQQVDAIIQKHETQYEEISFMVDCGSNLLSCYKHLVEKVSCANLGYTRPATGNCLAHVFNTAMGKALGSTGAESHGEPFFYFKKIKARLQRCVTWTQKSGKEA